MAEDRHRGAIPLAENNAKLSGPRSLLLERCEFGFGFTLRHFIVYPPESATLLGGCLTRAMDTIFVKRVHPRSPAARAGLCTGDRLVSVNGDDVAGMSYAAVVQLIQAAPQRLHLVVVPKEHDILQLYFGETAHNPETNQRLGRRRSPDNVTSRGPSAIPARVQPNKVKHRISSSGKPRLSLDECEEQQPINEQRRSSDGNRRDAVYGNAAWSPQSFSTISPASDADSSSIDSRNDSLDSRLNDSKDSLGSADSTSTLTGGDDDSLIMSRIRRSCEQKEEFLRRPVSYANHEGRLLAREFYARPQKLKPVWPPTHAGVDPARSATNHEAPPRRSEGREGRKASTALRRVREDDGEKEDDESNRSSTSPPADDRHAVPAVQLVSRRARQFERGLGAAERTPLYASELARLTSKRANPGVALRRREIERRAGTRELDVEVHMESPIALAANQLTPLTTRIHCEPPTNHDGPLNPTANQHAGLAQRINHLNPLRLRTEEAFLRARSNSAESWAAAFSPHHSAKIASDWPLAQEGGAKVVSDWPLPQGGGAKVVSDWPLPQGGGAKEGDEARHKVVRQDSYLAAVRTPVPSAERGDRPPQLAPPLADQQATPPRPSLLELAPHPHLPSSPLTHTSTQQLISALDAATGKAAGELPTTVVRRQKNTHHAQTDEDRLRRTSYLRATNSELSQLETEIEQEESEQRSVNRKWRPPVFPEDIQQLREFFEEGARPIRNRESQAAMLPTVEPAKEDLPALREGWLHCKITIIDGKRSSDKSWKQVWAVLQSDRTLLLYKDRPNQTPSTDNDPTSVDLRSCQLDATNVSSKKKHVLRLNTLSGTELLVQAEDAADADAWTAALAEEAVCVSPTSASKSRKLPAFRPRSPTGQSPASKTPKGQSEASAGAKSAKTADSAVKAFKAAATAQEGGKSRGASDPTSSPKSSTTWKGRVARQLRRMQGSAPSSPGAQGAGAGYTIGAALEDCAPSEGNALVPLLVAKCAAVVEERGLDIVGIYRVPGNTAAVHSLTEAVNKGFTFANCQDPRWTDVNVISSLLKLFFRKLPDALLTSELYPLFIDADKMDDPNQRIVTMRRLVRELPDHHYETLKFLCLHLKQVVAHSSANKMEARNLAIVFGPTLVRTADNNMITMVTDMSHQCRIVESLLLHVDWFFSPGSDEALELPVSSTAELEPSAMSHDLLIGNIQKVEGMRGGESVLAKVIGSSIISAANRKMQRKSRKSTDEPREVSIDSAVRRHQQEMEARQASAQEKEDETLAQEAAIAEASLPCASDRVEEAITEQPRTEDGLIRTYAGLSATTQERIRRFEQETKAMLQRDTSWSRREPEPVQSSRVTSTTSRTTTTSHTSESRVSVTNIHVNPLGSSENTEVVTKRHQLEVTSVRGDAGGQMSGDSTRETTDNGNLKRFKTGNEQGSEPLRLVSSLRCASLDSLQDALDRPPSEISDDGSDLLSSLTSTFDRKLKSLLGSATQTTTASNSATTTTTPVTSVTAAMPLLTLTTHSVTLPSTVTLDTHPAALTTHSVTLPSTVTLDTHPAALTSNSTTPPSASLPSASVISSTLPLVVVTSSTLTSAAAAAGGKQRSKIPTYRDPSLHRQPADKDKEAIRRRWLGEEGVPASPAPPPSPQHTLPEAAPSPRLEASLDAVEIPSPNRSSLSSASPTPNVAPQISSPTPNSTVHAYGRISPALIATGSSPNNGSSTPNNDSSNPNVSSTPNNVSLAPNNISSAPNNIGSVPNNISPAPNNVISAPNNISPGTDAVLRSNLRPAAKVRRSDSLSKTEKTESNRRRQEKENVKLKRRHGAKDGAIKRRHTVGGTKDLATLPWLDNRWAGEKEGDVGRGLRTSSPDLGRVDWREWGLATEGKQKGGVLESHV